VPLHVIVEGDLDHPADYESVPWSLLVKHNCDEWVIREHIGAVIEAVSATVSRRQCRRSRSVSGWKRSSCSRSE